MNPEAEHPLAILARRLNETGVRYAVFKGFEDTRTLLNTAGGDIDVLVDENDTLAFSTEARRAGFLVDSRSPVALGKHVTVWRAFDRPSGRFIMLHVYFKLCVSHVPPRRLGIEALVLDQSSISHGIRFAHAEVSGVLSYFFKILAGKTADGQSLQFDNPAVRSIIDSLFAQVDIDSPPNVDKLDSVLASVAKHYSTQSACESIRSRSVFNFWPVRRLFPRNKLGKGSTFSVHSDGSRGAEQSIEQTLDTMSEMMRIRIISGKSGVIGQIIGPLNRFRSSLAKRRGFLVLIRESHTALPGSTLPNDRRKTADLFVDIKSLKGQIQLVTKSSAGDTILDTTHVDSRGASIEITDRLVPTIANQIQ